MGKRASPSPYPRRRLAAARVGNRRRRLVRLPSAAASRGGADAISQRTESREYDRRTGEANRPEACILGGRSANPPRSDGQTRPESGGAGHERRQAGAGLFGGDLPPGS